MNLKGYYSACSAPRAEPRDEAWIVKSRSQGGHRLGSGREFIHGSGRQVWLV